MVLFIAMVAMTLAIVLRSRVEPSKSRSSPPPEGRRIRFRSKLFLYSWIHSFRVLYATLYNYTQCADQINLLAVRQALATMWFGRGMIHG